jgi:hypothetical protein
MKYVAAIIGAKVILPARELHPLRFVRAPLMMAVRKKSSVRGNPNLSHPKSGRAQCKSKVSPPRIHHLPLPVAAFGIKCTLTFTRRNFGSAF